MNTLYLHIGTTKTGTTSIQKFCLDNIDVLEKKGYTYPQFPYQYKDVTQRRNAHFLIAEDYKNRQGRFREGMNIIKNLFQKHPNVVLSDEGIWSDIYRKFMNDFWQALQLESKEGGFQIKIIVYLRRQDTYLMSGWNQGIKSGITKDCGCAWEDYIGSRLKFSKLNYGTNLTKLASKIGKENLVVRRFEPKRFYRGSIYADFLQTIGLELTDEYRIEQFESNEKLGGNTHEIQRIINNLTTDRTYHSFFRRALLSFSDVSAREYPSEMFSAEEAASFMEKFREENRKAAEEFFGGEELFDLSRKDVPKWEKNNPHMQDDLIRFTAACCMQLMDENAALRDEIHQLEQRIDKHLPYSDSIVKLGRSLFKKNCN